VDNLTLCGGRSRYEKPYKQCCIIAEEMMDLVRHVVPLVLIA
jgi:hypothetical protein